MFSQRSFLSQKIFLQIRLKFINQKYKNIWHPFSKARSIEKEEVLNLNDIWYIRSGCYIFPFRLVCLKNGEVVIFTYLDNFFNDRCIYERNKAVWLRNDNFSFGYYSGCVDCLYWDRCRLLSLAATMWLIDSVYI